jgi:hypothetical protein
MSLDDIYEIMSKPIGERDPLCQSVRMQVTRVVFMIGVKALLDGKLGREATRDLIPGVDDGSVEREFNPCASSRLYCGHRETCLWHRSARREAFRLGR